MLKQFMSYSSMLRPHSWAWKPHDRCRMMISVLGPSKISRGVFMVSPGPFALGMQRWEYWGRLSGSGHSNQVFLGSRGPKEMGGQKKGGKHGRNGKEGRRNKVRAHGRTQRYRGRGVRPDPPTPQGKETWSGQNLFCVISVISNSDFFWEGYLACGGGINSTPAPHLVRFGSGLLWGGVIKNTEWLRTLPTLCWNEVMCATGQTNHTPGGEDTPAAWRCRGGSRLGHGRCEFCAGGGGVGTHPNLWSPHIVVLALNMEPS